MDRRPFWLRHPGLATSTEMPQPSEQEASLQNCAQGDRMSVSFTGRARAKGLAAMANKAKRVFLVGTILRRCEVCLVFG